MGDQTLRVGIVGAGANTRLRHIPGLRAIDGVEIVAVANRSRESGERVAREFGIARVYAAWQELVEARDIDAICIGTWPNLHCPVTLAALESGKHVLCEARMAMTAAEARAMLDAARRRPHLVTQLVPAPGTLGLDLSTLRLSGGRRGDRELGEIVVPKERQVGWRVEEEFVNAIRGKEAVTRSTFEDGVKYMEFTEAVMRSGELGRAIDIPG